MTRLKAITIRIARFFVPPLMDGDVHPPSELTDDLAWMKEQEEEAERQERLVLTDPKKAVWTLQQKYTARRPMSDRRPG